MKTSRLFLVRHAETSANIDQVWHGDTDTELTDHGVSQIVRLGEGFHEVVRPDVIYSSPLIRTRRTAGAIADKFNLEVIADKRLMEMAMGEWEGISYHELHETHDALRQLRDNPEFCGPGGESPRDVKTRMVEAIDDIVAKHPGENIVVVTHGVAIAMTLAHLVHNDLSRWFEFNSHNTGITELCLETKGLLFFNQTDHLGDEERLVTGG